MAIRTWISLIWAGSRVKRGSMKWGRGASVTKFDPVGGNVHPGQTVHDTIHLGKDDTVLEGSRLDDGGGVLRVGAGIEVTLTVGAMGRHQGDLWGQVDEVTAEQLQVGMDGPDVDVSRPHELGQTHPHGARIGKIEPARDPPLENLDVLGQGQNRLDHVQAVDPVAVEAGQAAGQEIGLLLVVPLKADAIPGFEKLLEQGRDKSRIHHLFRSKAPGPLQAAIAVLFLEVPRFLKHPLPLLQNRAVTSFETAWAARRGPPTSAPGP